MNNFLEKIKEGFGFGLGMLLIIGLILSVYAFVEPTQGPTAGSYYLDSQSSLKSSWKTQNFTSDGNFTVSQGVSSIYVTGCAAGGGGGGGALDDDSYDQDGGGGGSGECARDYKIIVTPEENLSITIGTGGAGGLGVSHGSGAGSGGNGGDTTIENYLVLEGGKGGKGGISSSSYIDTFGYGGNGGGALGGTGGTGNSNNGEVYGKPGIEAYSIVGGNGGAEGYYSYTYAAKSPGTNYSTSGKSAGGSSLFGEGGSAYGNNGGFGAGGAGGETLPSSGTNGGDGGDGIIIISWQE